MKPFSVFDTAELSMFISDELAQERIRSSQNILNRVKRDDEPVDMGNVPLPQVPASIVSEDGSVELEEVQSKEDPNDDQTTLDSKELQKLLAGDNERIIGRRRSRTLEEQSSIGLTSALLSERKAAALHDISPMQANNYSHGFTSTDARVTGKTPKQELLEKIIDKNGVVVDLCFEKLIKAVSLLDDTALLKMAAKPEKLGRLASDMHRIVTNATPREAEEGAQTVHFHVWRPEVKTEDTYEIINVGGAQ